GQIDLPVLRDHLFHLLRRVTKVLKKVDQVPADVAAEESVFNVGALAGDKNMLDGSADVGCGVNQSAVYVENVDGKIRDGQAPRPGPGFRRRAGQELSSHSLGGRLAVCRLR